MSWEVTVCVVGSVWLVVAWGILTLVARSAAEHEEDAGFARYRGKELPAELAKVCEGKLYLIYGEQWWVKNRRLVRYRAGDGLGGGT